MSVCVSPLSICFPPVDLQHKYTEASTEPQSHIRHYSNYNTVIFKVSVLKIWYCSTFLVSILCNPIWLVISQCCSKCDDCLIAWVDASVFRLQVNKGETNTDDHLMLKSDRFYLSHWYSWWPSKLIDIPECWFLLFKAHLSSIEQQNAEFISV